MKRYFNKREKSPVRGYHLFKYEEERADGTAVIYPTYYTRHAGKDDLS